jgi:competence protein ComEA
MFKKILAALVLGVCALTAAWAVEINSASSTELEGVKGLGPKTAGSIVEERKKGNFKDWADAIKRVKSIGPKSAAKLSAAGLTVNGKAYEGAAAKKPAEAKKK